MIKITNELIDQLTQMTPKEVAEKYSFAEMVELTTELQRQGAELHKVVDDQQARIERGKAYVLKQYGPKPLLWMELVAEDEIQILLIINGEMNLYPETVSIYDALNIVDFIGEILRIPDKRRLTDKTLHNYKGLLRKAEMTDCECRLYYRQIMDWLTQKVEPKPAKINLPGQMYKLKGDVYKRA